ncbi:tenascin-R-like [Diadema setosum]|uniref:tenascin-R-like n=1 Tax=Diadema setosum TaxID=31175 RepID=UPI003B3AC588
MTLVMMFVQTGSDNGEDLIRTEETSLSLEDLEPETTYTVSVVAASTQQSIDTRSGERRENFTTTAVVISLSQIGSTSVLVIGTQTAFTLTYTPNDGDFQSGSNAEADQTLLSSLTPSQGYEVSIQNGSMTIDRINFFTTPGAPENVSLSLGSDNISSIVVQYQPPEGNFDGFRIEYSGSGVGADGNQPSPIIEAISSTETVIDGLSPGVEYTVNIQTFVDVDDGNVFSLATSQSITTESGPVASFYVRSKTNTSIIIKFASFVSVGNHRAFARADGETSRSGVQTGQQFEFTGLTPGNVYDITLLGEGSSELSMQMVQTYPDPPASLTLMALETSLTIVASWQAGAGKKT